jgi:FMN phosphatase YigB (HAD superfamily)
MTNKFKAIIFDLDDTLYSTANRLPGENAPNFDDMKLYDNVRMILEAIKSKKILLTHGVADIQNKKIDTLNIRNLFDEIIVVPAFTDKQAILDKIKKEFSGIDEVAVVGDRRDAEIRFGNEQGFTTILIEGYKYKALAPKDEMEIPTYEISRFADISQYI